MGVEPPDQKDDEVPGLLGMRPRIIVGVFFAVLYAITWGVHGNVAAGLVGGALGGLVVYLLLKERDERRVRRHRSGRPGPRP